MFLVIVPKRQKPRLATSADKKDISLEIALTATTAPAAAAMDGEVEVEAEEVAPSATAVVRLATSRALAPKTHQVEAEVEEEEEATVEDFLRKPATPVVVSGICRAIVYKGLSATIATALAISLVTAPSLRKRLVTLVVPKVTSPGTAPELPNLLPSLLLNCLFLLNIETL